jgi:hypothetical protein
MGFSKWGFYRKKATIGPMATNPATHPMETMKLQWPPQHQNSMDLNNSGIIVILVVLGILRY